MHTSDPTPLHATCTYGNTKKLYLPVPQQAIKQAILHWFPLVCLTLLVLKNVLFYSIAYSHYITIYIRIINNYNEILKYINSNYWLDGNHIERIILHFQLIASGVNVDVTNTLKSLNAFLWRNIYRSEVSTQSWGWVLNWWNLVTEGSETFAVQKYNDVIINSNWSLQWTPNATVWYQNRYRAKNELVNFTLRWENCCNLLRFFASERKTLLLFWKMFRFLIIIFFFYTPTLILKHLAHLL